MELHDRSYLARFGILCVLLSVLSVFCRGSFAADRIGLVKTYEPGARAIRQGGEMELAMGAEIFKGDTIVTDSTGAVGITFSDGSVITVGPGGKISIESFQFEPAKHEASFLSRIAKGSVAFVSGGIGRISPGAVQFKTPTATLGLHGTKILIEVE